MDDELRAAFAGITAEIAGLRSDFAGVQAESRLEFARIDRHFELNHLEHVKTREQMDRRFGVVDQEISAIKAEVAGLTIETTATRHELSRFRDWATGETIDLRSAISQLTLRFELKD